MTENFNTIFLKLQVPVNKFSSNYHVGSYASFVSFHKKVALAYFFNYAEGALTHKKSKYLLALLEFM